MAEVSIPLQENKSKVTKAFLLAFTGIALIIFIILIVNQFAKMEVVEKPKVKKKSIMLEPEQDLITDAEKQMAWLMNQDQQKEKKAKETKRLEELKAPKLPTMELPKRIKLPPNGLFTMGSSASTQTQVGESQTPKRNSSSSDPIVDFKNAVNILKGSTSAPDQAEKSTDIVVNQYPGINNGVLYAPGTQMIVRVSSGINSDNFTDWWGTLVYDIWDHSREYIIFNRGSLVNGGAAVGNGPNEIINSRIAIQPMMIRRSDGSTINIGGLGSPSDLMGMGGIQGKINHHLWWKIFGIGAIAITDSQISRRGTGRDSDSTFAGDVGQGASNVLGDAFRPYLNLTKTIYFEEPGTDVMFINKFGYRFRPERERY